MLNLQRQAVALHHYPAVYAIHTYPRPDVLARSPTEKVAPTNNRCIVVCPERQNP